MKVTLRRCTARSYLGLASRSAEVFGALMRNLRKELDWTLADPATARNMDAGGVGVLECSRNMPSSAVLRLARTLNVNVAELVAAIEKDADRSKA